MASNSEMIRSERLIFLFCTSDGVRNYSLPSIMITLLCDGKGRQHSQWKEKCHEPEHTTHCPHTELYCNCRG